MKFRTTNLAVSRAVAQVRETNYNNFGSRPTKTSMNSMSSLEHHRVRTGSGFYSLNVFYKPNLEPVFGGTYFGGSNAPAIGQLSLTIMQRAISGEDVVNASKQAPET